MPAHSPVSTVSLPARRTGQTSMPPAAKAAAHTRAGRVFCSASARAAAHSGSAHRLPRAPAAADKLPGGTAQTGTPNAALRSCKPEPGSREHPAGRGLSGVLPKAPDSAPEEMPAPAHSPRPRAYSRFAEWKDAAALAPHSASPLAAFAAPALYQARLSANPVFRPMPQMLPQAARQALPPVSASAAPERASAPVPAPSPAPAHSSSRSPGSRRLKPERAAAPQPAATVHIAAAG